jgi:hypothetical protein
MRAVAVELEPDPANPGRVFALYCSLGGNGWSTHLSANGLEKREDLL